MEVSAKAYEYGGERQGRWRIPVRRAVDYTAVFSIVCLFIALQVACLNMYSHESEFYRKLNKLLNTKVCVCASREVGCTVL